MAYRCHFRNFNFVCIAPLIFIHIIFLSRWGVHNCQPEEAVGVVCKTAVDNCKDGYWKCDETPMCIPTAFICDSVFDCADKSDESDKYCNVNCLVNVIITSR